MVAPVLESWSVSEANVGVGSMNITKPSGVVSGDLLVVIALNDSTSGSNQWNTTLSGFTGQIFFGGSSADTQGYIWLREADGTEGASVTVSLNSGTLDIIGWYLRISGQDTTTPWNIDNGGGQNVVTSSHTITSATTTVDDCLAFYALAFDGGDGEPFSVSGGNGSGWAEIDEAESNSANNTGLSACFGSQTLASLGALGDATVTSNKSDGSSDIMFAIAPAAGGSATLTALTGAYTLTGNAMTNLWDHVMPAEVGSYALTGNAATLSKGFTIIAEVGSYALTGNDVTFVRTYVMPAEVGSYNLTGNATELLWGHVISALTGAYNLTGNDVELLLGTALTAELGSYSLTGNDVGLLYSEILVAELGSYTLTGNDVGLQKGFTIITEAGSYTLNGEAVNLLIGHRLDAELGAYALTGNDAALLFNQLIGALTGSYNLTGNDVTLTVGAADTLIAEVGAYALTGNAATLIYSGATAAKDFHRTFRRSPRRA